MGATSVCRQAEHRGSLLAHDIPYRALCCVTMAINCKAVSPNGIDLLQPPASVDAAAVVFGECRPRQTRSRATRSGWTQIEC